LGTGVGEFGIGEMERSGFVKGRTGSKCRRRFANWRKCYCFYGADQVYGHKILSHLMITEGILKFRIQDGLLKRWFAAAVTLTIVTIALAYLHANFASSIAQAFEIAIVIACVVTVIGFYFVMFYEAVRERRGLAKAVLIVSFILFPVGSGLIYFWWTRYVQDRGVA
jgi:hypothetical protein